MAAFDFITNDDFRCSLEADQAELLACVAAKAWKSVHVLAGSIIEAVLLDYLVGSGYQNQSPDDLLKMDLHKAIDACLAEGVLTRKTAQLSIVVKDYRNLIHPGRSVRLSESVSEDSARVAQALVEMIVAEVGKKKSEKYGNTAQQLVAKIVVDPSAVGILDHLLKGMKACQIRRCGQGAGESFGSGGGAQTATERGQVMCPAYRPATWNLVLRTSQSPTCHSPA